MDINRFGDIDSDNVRAARKGQWEAMAGPAMVATDASRLPDQHAAASVMQWRYNPTGMILQGPARTGKTRTAWLLMRRLIIDEGRSAMAFDMLGWDIACRRVYGQLDTADVWFDRLALTDVLMLDDPLKGRMTEATEFSLLGLIDRRARFDKPTIICMNESSKAIAARMTDAGISDRFDALMGRLIEFHEVIKFRAPEREGGC